MTGRKRLPTEVKRARGTLKNSRENPAAPDPSSDRPVCPDHLSDEAKRWFSVIEGRMEELGTSSASWTEVLAAAAIRQCEVVQLTEVIDEHGYTYETVNTGGSVMVRARPEVAQRSEAHRHLQSLLAELGLTPAARSKVTAKSKGSSNAFLKLA